MKQLVDMKWQLVYLQRTYEYENKSSLDALLYKSTFNNMLKNSQTVKR